MPVDYLEDEEGDILIENGALVRGESTTKHFKDLLLSDMGDIKQHPSKGVGVENYIDDDEFGAAYPKIQNQIEGDGATIYKLGLYENGDLDLNAAYES